MRLRIGAILLFVVIHKIVFGSVFLFEIKRGEERAHVRWQTQFVKDGSIELASTNDLEKVTHQLVCDAEYNTIQWRFEKQQQNTKYSVLIENEMLIFNGVIKGEKVDKKSSSEGLLWFQFHALSLPKYLNSEFDKLNFISIRPDDGKIFRLTAIYRGIEEINVKGETVQAIQVDVHLAGLLSKFGHVTYWFRTNDHVFVKFQGAKGFAGNSLVTYELIEMDG